MGSWWITKTAGARDWLRARMRERVTTAGLAFLSALALVGLAAFASANNLLFLLLAAMLATLMVSGFVSRLGLVELTLDVQLPDHIAARETVSSRLVLHNEKRLAPSFSIRLVGVDDSVFTTELYFPVVPARAAVETTVDVRFPRRGLYDKDSFLFTTRFPFGFAERRARVEMKRDVLIYPALDAQPGFEHLVAEIAGDAETLFRGRGHDFHRIRPYEPFESARHVDWRATAHTGQLMVREFAHEQEHLITLFLDLESPREHEAWFERAIECCSYLAWRFSARGARLRFRTQDIDILVPVENDVFGVLKYLALAECRHRAAPLPNLNEKSLCVVFSASPARLRGSGWDNARVIDPSTLSPHETA